MGVIIMIIIYEKLKNIYVKVLGKVKKRHKRMGSNTMTDIIFNDKQYNIEKLSLKSKFFKDMKDSNIEITKLDFTDRGEAFLIILDYLVNDTYIKPNINTPQLASELLDIIDELLITDDNLKNDINKIFKNHLDNCIDMHNHIVRLNKKIIFKEYPKMEYLKRVINMNRGNKRKYIMDKIGSNIYEWYNNNEDMFLKYNDNIEKNSEKIQKKFPESYKENIDLIEKKIESKAWVRYMKNIYIDKEFSKYKQDFFRDDYFNLYVFNTILQDMVYNVNIIINIKNSRFGQIFYYDNHLRFNHYIDISPFRINDLYTKDYIILDMGIDYRDEDYVEDINLDGYYINHNIKDLFKNINKLKYIKINEQEHQNSINKYYIRDDETILRYDNKSMTDALYNDNSITDEIYKNNINFIKKVLNIIELDDEDLDKIECTAIRYNNNEILELLNPYVSDTRNKETYDICIDNIDINIIHKLENRGFKLDLNCLSVPRRMSDFSFNPDLFKLSFSRNPMWNIKEKYNERSLKEENKNWSELYQELINMNYFEELKYVFNDKKLFNKEHISSIKRNIIPINIIEEYKNKEEISYIDYHHICSYLRKSKLNTFLNKDTDISFIFNKSNRYNRYDSDDDYDVDHYYSVRQVIDIIAYDKYKDKLLKLLNTDSFFEQIKLYNNTFKNILKWISTNRYYLCFKKFRIYQQEDNFYSIDFDLADLKEPKSCSYHCLECGTCDCLEDAKEGNCLCNCIPFCRSCGEGGIGGIHCRCETNYLSPREGSYWHEDNWREREHDRDDEDRRGCD